MTAPTLSGFSAAITFNENIVNATPQLLDASVTFTDPDNDFDGGFLILSGLLAEDRVSVRNQGSGAGQIGFDGVTGVVTYGGVQIGTLAGGVGGTLTITFNASASSAAIDALIQNLTYANVSDTPTASRAFALDVVDASGAGLASSVDALTVRAGAANPFNGVDYGQFSNPSLFDYDSDGDLDMVLGGQATSPLRLFRNDNGADTFTEQTGAANPFAALGAFNGFIAPRFGDIDGDGDKDLVLGVNTGQTIRTFRNDGGAFTELTGANNPFAGAFGDGYPIPAFADIDGDGDEDAVFGKGDGTFVLYRNENDSLAFTRVAQGANPFGAIDVGQYSAPSFVDLDADGDLDFVAGRQAGGVASYRNDGGVFTALTGANDPLTEVITSDSVLVFGDIDGNGAADLIIGQTDGTLTVYTNAKVTTVNVTAQNDASVNTVPGAQTTVEDAALVFSTAGGNAIQVSEAEGGSLTVTLTAANGTFSLSGVAGLSFTTGDGTGDASATFSGSLASINAALNGLSFAPRDDFHGAASLTISTSDGALSDADTVGITVTPVNDAPVEAANTGATVDEGAAVVLTGAMLDYDDLEQPGADIEYTVTSLSNGALTLNGAPLGVGDTFTQADIEAGRVSFTHDGSETTSAGFGFDVSDGQGGGVSGQAFDLDVNPVNDAPEGADVTRTIDEEAAYTFLASDFAVTDAEGDSLASVVITTVPLGGTLLLGGVAIMAGAEITLAAIVAGDLTYQPAADAYGTGAASFTFQVRDDGGTANGGADADPSANRFNFDITAVNDAPVEAVNAGATIDEGAAVVLTGAMLDHDDVEQVNADIVYTVTSATNGALTLSGMALSVGGTFTQADIEAGLVEFTHDGSETASAGFGFDISDGQGGSVTGRAFAVDVTPVNDAPSGADVTRLIDEDEAYTFLISDFAVTDAEGDSLGSVVITTLPASGALLLDGVAVSAGDEIMLAEITAGDLTYQPVADANGTGAASFTFQIRDDGGTANGGVDLDPSADSFTFDITAVNDAPVEAANTGGAVDEGGAIILTGGMLDHDDLEQADAEIAYAVTSLSNGTLTLNGVALAVGESFTQADIEAGRVAFAHDGAETTSAGFGFDVSDGQGGAVSGQAFDIDVTPVNDAPSGADVTRATDEDTTYTFLISDFSIADAEGGSLASVVITTLPLGGTLLLGGVAIMAGDEITVAQITAGDLTYEPAANANGTGTAGFTFQVRDDGGAANGGVDLDPSAGAFTFDITPVNDAPTEAANADATVDEGDAVVLTGAMLDHDDLEQADADIEYTVTSLTNGVVTLSGSALVAGGTFTQADIEAGLVVFAHDGSETASAGFGFDVSDGQGGTVTGPAFDIDVTPVNDAPSGADVTRTIDEDAPYTFMASDFAVADAESDSLASVVITALPSGGTLLLGGVAIMAGAEITLAAITDGDLTYQPAADANGTGAASFTFQVRDDGGTADGGVDLDPSANSFTFDITAVNDAPVNAVPGAQATAEDTALVFSTAAGNAIQVADGDSGSLTVTLTATNGTFSLSGLAGLNFTAGDGTGDQTATFSGTLAAINAALDGLSFAPDAEFNGPASLALSTSDGAASDADTVAITITPVNDAPTEAANAGATVDEGDAVILTGAMLDHDDLEQVDADIVYTVTSLSNGQLTLDGVALSIGGTFTQADIEAGLVAFAHDGSETASAGFGFDVSDGQGGAVTGQVFDIDVTPVNDAPAGADVTRTIDEDATYVFQTSDFAITDTEGDSLVSVVITALPAGGTLLLGGVAIMAGAEITLAAITAGDLTYQPAADANGTGAASFTFQIRDDGGVDNGGTDLDPAANRFTFDITAVNDAPVETANVGTDLTEGAALTLTGAMLDHDDLEQADADIEYTVASVSNGQLTLNGSALAVGDSFTQADIEAGRVSFTHDGSETASAGFGFDVSDGQGGSVTGQAFDIDVTPVDDAPTARDDAVSVAETGTASGSVFANNGSGEDSDPEGLSVTEVNGDAAAVGQQITLASGALLTLNADGTYAYDPNGAFNLAAPGSGASNITATDSFTYTLAGGGAATVTITVQGQDGDDRLEGTTGDDALNGGIGADRMEGGLGDDTYYVGHLGDRVVELRGQGNDQVFSSVNFNAQKQGAVVETITLTGTARTAIGDVFANTLIGNARQNILNGYKGADTMEGRGGNDIYTVDNVGDVVIELANAGIDRVNSAIDYVLGAHLENLTLLGGADLAGAGNDGLNHVVGNRGDNVITGSGGLDILTGGLGSDTFVYTSVSDSTYAAYDRIMDLEADDTIDLRAIDANENTADINEAFVLVDRYSRTAGEMILTSGNGLTFLVGDTDGDGKSDFRIALIGDHGDFDNILG